MWELVNVIMWELENVGMWEFIIQKEKHFTAGLASHL